MLFSCYRYSRNQLFFACICFIMFHTQHMLVFDCYSTWFVYKKKDYQVAQNRDMQDNFNFMCNMIMMITYTQTHTHTHDAHNLIFIRNQLTLYQHGALLFYHIYINISQSEIVNYNFRNTLRYNVWMEFLSRYLSSSHHAWDKVVRLRFYTRHVFILFGILFDTYM